MSRYPLSTKKTTRRRRPQPNPPAALEVHQFDGYTATLYPGMVEFSLDQTALARAIEQRDKPKAATRKAAAGPKEGRGKKRTGPEKISEPLANGQPGEAAAKAAEAVGMSRPTRQAGPRRLEGGGA